jgi:imidazole glycerol-phosphate synthase subunit HisF
MLRKRVIVCLDVHDGRAVREVSLGSVQDLGDPVDLARRYEAEGADEILFCHLSESAESRSLLLDQVRRAAEQLRIPLAVGGGVNDASDIALLLRAGADKVGINTAAVTRPELISEAAERFGSACLVVGIDARLERRQIELLSHAEGPARPAGAAAPATWFRVFTHRGRNATDLDAVDWARNCAGLGAGEVLITSIDQHGRRGGYDLELTARVAEAVAVPVIASGGAGEAHHLRDAFLLAGADAALLGGMLHGGATSIGTLKAVLAEAGIAVREGPMKLPQP